jgi:sucrose phosphorylase
MRPPNDARERIHQLLRQLYPPQEAESAYRQIADLIASYHPAPSYASEYFSERTITLITYGDTLSEADQAPLITLHHFLNDYLKDVIDTVHILPFFPYSSDDGFSVIDYTAVNPVLGSWDDVVAISGDFRLMADAVINHMSAQSEWFKRFLAGDPDYTRLFLTESPDTDLSLVTRPRTSPLLTPFVRADGQTVYVWTTFSADQVDLDYRDPQTLIRILDVLLFYVAKGAQVIRLDAIAYLWKRVGTTCIHLPETHAVVQLMRAVLDAAAPQVILITETNVPHAENISYFGDDRGFDEAQLVYNFTLPPLLLHTLLCGNATNLCDWINSLPALPARRSFFNFTASHDGIGVRPVEGILTPGEILALMEAVTARGGQISYKTNADGTRSPYELNITYVDAVAPLNASEATRVAAFVLSQAIMLTLAGIPAIYIHSLLGSHNDIEGMRATGHNRSINRAKLQAESIREQLADPSSVRARVFGAIRLLLAVRRSSRAFHPSGSQRAFTLNEGRVLGLERFAPDGSERITALFNVTDQPQQVIIADLRGDDLLAGERIDGGEIALAAYQARWVKR